MWVNERLPMGYLLLKMPGVLWLLRHIGRGRKKPSLGRILDETVNIL